MERSFNDSVSMNEFWVPTHGLGPENVQGLVQKVQVH